MVLQEPLTLYTHTHTCSLFGDEQEVAFWTVALFYMLREKSRLDDPRYKVSLLLSKLPSSIQLCIIYVDRFSSMLIVVTPAVTSSVLTLKPLSALVLRVCPPPLSLDRALRTYWDLSTLTPA